MASKWSEYLKGHGILTVMDCLCLSFEDKTKTIQSSQRASRIFKSANMLSTLRFLREATPHVKEC